jgi:hypothetical protein
MNTKFIWKLFLDASTPAQATKIAWRFAETTNLDVRISEPSP